MMMNCYDRAHEKSAFIKSEKNVIIFTNSYRNGMTTFMYNILTNEQYIFIRENYEAKIVFDYADRSTRRKEEFRRNFLDFQIESIENTKFVFNLFYLLPNLGTFFRNVGIDLSNKAINGYSNLKYSFESFLKDYVNSCKNENHNDLIYLIVDHADNCSISFLNKIKNLINLGNIKIVICCESPLVKAEYKCIFDDFDLIDFSKPKYNDAIVIFNSMNMDCSLYTKDMYDKSNNLVDFFAKYQNEKRLTVSDIEPIDNCILSYLKYFSCYFSKKEFELLCIYLERNACVNMNIDADYYFDKFLQSGIIIRHGKYFVSLAVTDNAGDVSKEYLAFCTFALNYYSCLTYDFLYHVFKIYAINNFEMSEEIYKVLLNNSTNIDETKEIINSYRTKNFSFREYLEIIRILFDKRLYDLLFDYPANKIDSLSEFNKFLYLVIKDKKHMKINNSVYYRKAMLCFKKYNDINIRCLIAILNIDYYINHDKKRINVFLQQSHPFFYKNFEQSKYFYILTSIIAYYIEDNNSALYLYDYSIEHANELEKYYFLSNKFAFTLSKTIKQSSSISACDSIYNELTCNGTNWILEDSFFNTNILLFKSMKYYENYYNLYNIENKLYNDDIVFLHTWDLFKLLNSLLLDFKFNDDFNMSNYIKLENLINKTNREPSKNIYFYNLYLIALSFGEKKLASKAKHYLKTKRDFKYSNIYKEFLNVQELKNSKTFNPKDHVRFGYIFSRLTEIGYLLDEIADFIK